MYVWVLVCCEKDLQESRMQVTVVSEICHKRPCESQVTSAEKCRQDASCFVVVTERLEDSRLCNLSSRVVRGNMLINSNCYVFPLKQKVKSPDCKFGSRAELYFFQAGKLRESFIRKRNCWFDLAQMWSRDTQRERARETQAHTYANEQRGEPLATAASKWQALWKVHLFAILLDTVILQDPIVYTQE